MYTYSDDLKSYKMIMEKKTVAIEEYICTNDEIKLKRFVLSYLKV